MVMMRRNIQIYKMNDKSGETLYIDQEDFNNVIAKFKRKQLKPLISCLNLA